LKKLKPLHLNAIDLLVTGKSQKQVAQAIGVRPETVCRWLNCPLFIDALNQAHQDVRLEVIGKFNRAASAGADLLYELCLQGDFKTALAVTSVSMGCISHQNKISMNSVRHNLNQIKAKLDQRIKAKS
jgi:hypothetical protein